MPSDLIICTNIGFISFIYCLSIQKKYKKNNIVFVFILGYFLRVILLFVDIYLNKYFLLPYSGGDSEMFFRAAINVAEGGETRHGFFVFVMGTVFRLFGISRLWAQFLIMLCSIVALHYGYKSLLECKISDYRIHNTMFILAVLPNYTILSCLFLREALIYMFLTISLYCIICWMTRDIEWYYFLSFLFAFLAMRFHSGLVALPIGYFLIRFLYNNSSQRFTFDKKNLFISICVLLISGFIATKYKEYFLGKMISVDNLEDIAVINEQGGSSYAKYVGDSSSVKNFILYTPLRVFFFLFSPLPVFWRGLMDIIAFCFSSLFYLWPLASTIMFLRINKNHNIRRSLIIAMLLIAAISSFVFAWGVSNAGTACRHREKMAIIYGIMLALSQKNKMNNKDNLELNIK